MNIINKLKVVMWNVGFIDKDVSSLLSGDEYEITWMEHGYTDRFFADPFLLSLDEERLIILAEEYMITASKGRIVKLTLDRQSKKLLYRELLIDSPYHLSYPFIWNGFIIPEQNLSGKWIKYNMDGREMDTLANIPLIDGTVFNDGDADWVFGTRIIGEKSDAIKKLYRYQFRDGKLIEDSEVLIKNSMVASRPAGNFFCRDNIWYRVAQSSTSKVYGESVSICKIINNSDSKYEEEIVKVINANSSKKYNRGLHTFNAYDGIVVVDGFEMQMCPILKLISKIKYYKNKI